MSRFRPGALGRVVRSGVGRRRVQTLVTALATAMAVASAVAAGALMVAADAPFDNAFARQDGAHLTAEFDPARVGDAQLAETAGLDGVTATAGPFPVTTIGGEDDAGRRAPTMTLVGRDGPAADTDDLDLRSGRWAERPGEVVLEASFDVPGFRQGSTLTLPDGADGVSLTVVGFATSVSDTADAWAVPDQVTDLAAAAGGTATRQMLYRFDAAGTAGQIADRRQELADAVPSGALLGTQSWLDVKRAADQGAAPTIPFLVAFGVLGIGMSVIIVGSVVSGAVGTSLRRIGILKAIGFTPREVVTAYVAQALIPAGAGVAVGVVLGNLLAAPLLASTEQAYGTASLSVAWWVDVVVPAGALLVVAVAALVPALRAGRLRTVEAIAVGRAPRTGRGRWAHRAAGRLPLPRAVTYGLAGPFAHPVRTLAMLLAVAFGTLTATFATGLAASLTAITEAQDFEEGAPVVAVLGGPAAGHRGPEVMPAEPEPEPGSVPVADPAAVRAAIEAQEGTASYYGLSEVEVTVGGLSGAVPAALYEGASPADGPEVIDGRWFGDAGEVVVPTRFLERTGTALGDTVSVTYQEATARLRIVGEVFDPSDDGLRVHAGLGAFPGAQPGVYHIEPAAGVSPVAYADRLGAALRPLGGDALAASSSASDGIVLALQAMAALLTLMLVSVAGLGVLNSVVLDTRSRVHDLGVCKAIGMTPRQTVTLVLASVAGIGLVGGLAGVPAGVLLHGWVLPAMGRTVGTNLPPSILEVYGAPQLLLLGLAGIAIAVLGALLPAGWAARTRTATALRTE